ncbi:hypothetical protein Tco_0982696 [Tanacetum coccineum]
MNQQPISAPQSIVSNIDDHTSHIAMNQQPFSTRDIESPGHPTDADDHRLNATMQDTSTSALNTSVVTHVTAVTPKEVTPSPEEVSSIRKRSRFTTTFPNAYIERQQRTANVAQPAATAVRCRRSSVDDTGDYCGQCHYKVYYCFLCYLRIQTETGQIGMPSNICCVVVEYLAGVKASNPNDMTGETMTLGYMASERARCGCAMAPAKPPRTNDTVACAKVARADRISLRRRLRSPGKQRLSKSQRSTNSSVSSGSNPTMFQDMLQQQHELDRKEKNGAFGLRDGGET